MKPSNEYLDIVRKLPRPTEEQTEQFLYRVSSLRSWYKHLGYPKGKAFLFFLNPNVGRKFVYKGKGDYYNKSYDKNLSDNEDLFYYRSSGWFGHWDFFSNGGETIMDFSVENGMVDEHKQLGYNILSPSNKIVALPAELKAIGTVEINRLFFKYRESVLIAHSNILKSEAELELERANLIKKIKQTMKNFLDYVYD